MAHQETALIRLIARGVFCLLLSANAVSADETSLAAITIPPDSGHVTELVEAKSPSRRIILIQDAHQNIEAQRHIAEILAQLVERNGLKLILIEGGSGDVGLGRFRKMSTPAGRRELAEHFLKTGMASGPEYLAMTSDWGLVLWGVEDPKLYDSNFSAFLLQQKLGPELEASLKQIDQNVEQAIENGQSNDIRELRTQAAAFDAGKIDLKNYVPFLLDKAVHARVDLKTFPALARYAVMRDIEKSLNLQQVGADQQVLLKELQSKLDADDMTALVEKARRLKAGNLPAAAFYSELDRLTAKAQVDRSGFPELDRYIRYLAAKDALDSRQMFEEITSAKTLLTLKLARTDDERMLYEISDGLKRLMRLSQLKWLPVDYDHWKAEPDFMLIGRWMPWLKRRGLAPQLTGARIDSIERNLFELTGFYTAVGNRDAEILRRSLEKMEQENASIAALILGGFHADSITRLFAERGAEVVVVTPNVGDTGGDEDLYHFMLRAKYDNGRYLSSVGAP